MGSYYLDIETTGKEPGNSKIITIQWQELERFTGKPIGELNFLKEWQSSEKNIIEEFIDKARINDAYPFTFVPIGYNLFFEHRFLLAKSTYYELFPIEIISRPYIDMQQLAILMNKGEFKGTRLNDVTGKPSDGSNIPVWYHNQNFDKIEEYVIREASEFTKFVQRAYKYTPTLSDLMRNDSS